MSLDSGIRKEYKQQYIAYKVDTNFANIKISKNDLTVGLSIPFEAINDPQGISRDTTNIGNFANNDVLFKVAEGTDINNVMELVVQALVYQMED